VGALLFYLSTSRALLLALFLFLTVVQAFSVASASPWPRGDNHLFVSSRANYFRATDDFLSFTSGDTNDQFQRFETDTYLEFGLTDKVTLGGKLVYGTSTISNQFESRSASGFSEIEAFVQHQLWSGQRDVGALSIIGALPSRFETGVRPGIEGDGGAVEARFLYGRDLVSGPQKVFAGIEAGYRKRFGGAADQGRIDITFGFEPSQKILFLVQSFNTLSVRNENNDGADFDVFKAAPSLIWRGGKRWSVQGGVIHEYAGRNLSRGTTYFVGLWTVF